MPGPEDLADRRGLGRTVYEPAEDSHLLATTAVEWLGADAGGDLVLDLGTGSGYVGARVASETGARVVASDLNPHSCRRARDGGLPAVRADLFDPFRDGAFDAVLFNPPYLPTPPELEWDDWEELALSGGESGLRVVGPFLRSVRRVLAPAGEALVLASSLTGLGAVDDIAGEAGLDTREIAEESFPFERLVVLSVRPA